MKKNIIKSIQDQDPIAHDSGYAGFVITCSNEVITIGIANEQYCCEDWGYICSEDDLDAFIGAEVLKVEVVDECYDKKMVINAVDGVYAFVNIETNKGLLQFTLYNIHNGYYGHSAIVTRKKKGVDKVEKVMQERL